MLLFKLILFVVVYQFAWLPWSKWWYLERPQEEQEARVAAYEQSLRESAAFETE